jgi:hypothetical protein
MGLWDWLKQLFSGEPPPQRQEPDRGAWRDPRRAGPPPPATPPQVVVNPFPTDFSQSTNQVIVAELVGPPAPSRPPVAPQQPVARPAPQVATLTQYDAGAFAPLSDDEIRRRAKTAGRSLFSAWFGRRDRIPPTTDQRTQLIDAGMVGHGFITVERLTEIHRVGQQMDVVRPDLEMAHTIAKQAQTRTEEERKKIKEQKKAEAAERKRQRAAAIAHRKATDIVFLGRGVSRSCPRRPTWPRP